MRKPAGVDAEAALDRGAGEADVLADHVQRLLALDQPGAALEAELDVVRPRGEHVDVVVGVVADTVAVGDELLEPVDVRLLQRPPDEKEVDDPARGLHAPRRLDGVVLRLVVEVALVVVPVGRVPRGEVARHLQVERDGDAPPLAG